MIHFSQTKQMLRDMPDLYSRIERKCREIETKYQVHMSFGDKFEGTAVKPDGKFYFESDPAMSRIMKPYNCHDNPYCNYIRTQDGYKRCINAIQKKKMIYQKHGNKPFYSSCYMGIEEYHFPVEVNGRLVAEVSFGQFSKNMNASLTAVVRQAERFGYETEECKKLYLQTVKERQLDTAAFEMDVMILCDMLSGYYAAMMQNRREKWNKKESKREIMQEAMDYISLHYSENITLHDVARACYCNPNYLSGLFQKKLQMGFVQYLNIIRINNSKTLLLIKDLSIGDIAERVGFSSATVFIKAFKRYEGITPYQSRKQLLK